MTLGDLQISVRDALAQIEALKSCEIVLENVGDPMQTIAAAQAKNGCCALVKVASFRPESTASKHAVGRATLIITFSETPAINRKRPNHITAMDAAELAANELNLLTIAPDHQPLILAEDGITSAIDAAGNLYYSITISTEHQL